MQGILFGLGEVDHFALAEHRQDKHRNRRSAEKGDDAEATTLALALDRPSQFAGSASAVNRSSIRSQVGQLGDWIDHYINHAYVMSRILI